MRKPFLIAVGVALLGSSGAHQSRPLPAVREGGFNAVLIMHGTGGSGALARLLEETEAER